MSRVSGAFLFEMEAGVVRWFAAEIPPSDLNETGTSN